MLIFVTLGERMTHFLPPRLRIDRSFSLRATAHGLLFAGTVFLAVVLLLSPTEAAEVVILKSADLPYYDQAVQAFRSSLSLETTVTEYTLAGNMKRGREIAKALRGAPPDVILAVGLKAALAAKLELVDTPTVFCLVLNPEAHGLPAPNMTGILMRIAPGSQLASIQTLAPRARQIGLLYDNDRTGDFVDEARRVARKSELELITVPVHSSTEVPGALRTLLPKIDLLWLIQDQTVVTQDSLSFILTTTLESKVPVFGFSPTLVQQGALGALVVNAWDIGLQAARLEAAILLGGSKSRPVLHDPYHPHLALNLNSAEYFGLSPSREVLRTATLLYGGPGALAQKDLEKDMVP
jgi:putative ABC transport system substrate-binding protein